MTVRCPYLPDASMHGPSLMSFGPLAGPPTSSTGLLNHSIATVDPSPTKAALVWSGGLLSEMS